MTKPGADNSIGSQRAITLADIAARCGLSVTAAAWAMRGKRPQVSEETIARVQAAARELGYDPSRHDGARRLALRRVGIESLNHQVALLVPAIFHETNYHIMLFRGVADILAPERYGMLTVFPLDNSVEQLPESFVRGELDGIIVLGAMEGNQQLIEELRGRDGFGARPVVCLTTQLPGCASVLLDDYAGGYALADHLLHLGHRALLVHDGMDFRSAQRRLGVQAACRDRGLDPDRHLHCYPWHSNDLSLSETELLDLLRRYPEVTGILGPDDLDTRDIADCLQRAGYRIPEDYSLTGFDDTDALLNERRENILTTVRVPVREAGQIAARHLLDCIVRQAPPATISVPVSLVVRASTAPPLCDCSDSR